MYGVSLTANFNEEYVRLHKRVITPEEEDSLEKWEYLFKER